MSSNIGDLAVSLNADVAQFQQKLAQASSTISSFAVGAEKQVSKVGASITELAKSFDPLRLAIGGVTTAIAGFTLEGIKESITGVMEARAEIYRMSQNTGIAVEQLSALKTIARDTGTSFDSITGMTSKFTKAIGSAETGVGKQAEAFKNLGIDLKDHNGNLKDNLTLQQEAAAKLNTYTDGVQKDLYYQALWGKSAMENKYFLQQLGDAQSLQGTMTTEQAKQAEELEVNLKKLSVMTGQWKRDLADALIPTLVSFTSELMNLKKAAMEGGWIEVLNQEMGALFGRKNVVVGKSIDELTKQVEDGKKKMAALAKERDEPDTVAWAMGGKDYDSEIQDLQKEVTLAQNMLNIKKAQKDQEEKAAAAEKARKDPNGNKLTQLAADAKTKDLTNEILGLKLKVWETEQKTNGATVTRVQMLQKELDLNKNNPNGKYANTTQADRQRLLQATQQADDADYWAERKKWQDEGDAATKRSNDSLDKLINSARILYATEKDASEETKTRALLESDEYKSADALKKTQLLDLAKENDLKAQTLKYDQVSLSLQQQLAGITSNLDKTLKQRLESANAIRRETDEEKIKLSYEKALADPSLTPENKTKLLQQQADALALINQKYAEIEANEQSYLAGAQQAVIKYNDGLRNVAAETEQMTTRAFTNMEDALVQFTMTGKLSFTNLINQMVADLIRLQVRSSMTSAFSWLTGMIGGGSSGPTGLASLGPSVNTAFPSANGNIFSGGKVTPFARGGVLGGPTMAPMALMGEAGPEAVMPLTRGSDGKLGVAASGSGGVVDASTQQNNVFHINIANQGDPGNPQDNAKMGRQIRDQLQQFFAEQLDAANRAGGRNNRVTLQV